MGISPASTMAAVVVAFFGRVGNNGCSDGWLGRNLFGGVPRSRYGWLVLLSVCVCGPTSWQGGVTRRKLCASALPAATLACVAIPLEDVVRVLVLVSGFRVKT